MSLEHVPMLLQNEQFKVYEFPSLRPGPMTIKKSTALV